MTLRRSRPPVLGSRVPQANNYTEASAAQNTERTASSQRSASSERASSSERQSTKQQQQSTKPKLPAKKAVVAALQQLQQLTTRTPESVIGIEPNEGGWRVTVEVVESARIPDTADIMAEYVVDIASDGDLASYKRGARYFRGRTREEDPHSGPCILYIAIPGGRIT